MLEVYWGCLVGGILFTLATIIFGDFFGDLFDGLPEFSGVELLQSTVLAGAITAFGGAGILLTRYSGFGAAWIIGVIAFVVAFIAAIAAYFGYVRPMRNAETSTSYSMNDLTGRVGEVITSIPAVGFGEVLLNIGGGFTNQIAESFDGKPQASGTRVVVVEVKDGTLKVTDFENKPLED